MHSTELNLGTSRLDLRHPHVMGVVNVTPDSFSDPGRFFDRDLAIREAESMTAQGASFIDIGGESTRPGADAVAVQDELDRVMPVIESINARVDVHVSIDTSKPEVMREAASAGCVMINDVYALQRQGALDAAAEAQCAVCIMHMQGQPRTMQNQPGYVDVVAEVASFLKERLEVCEKAGILTDRLVIDPGFGFGKTDVHNVKLLASLGKLAELDRPLMVGISRKRTLGNLAGRDETGRGPAGLAAAVLAYERGAHIIRTHDVAATVDALKVAAVIRGTVAEERRSS